MTNRTAISLLVVLLLAAVTLAGCASSSGTLPADTAPEPAPSAAPSAAEPGTADAEAAEGEDLEAEGFGEEDLLTEESAEMEVQTLEQEVESGRAAMRTVYFPFDSFALSDVAMSAIEANATWLRQHPKVRVTVAGHCDERGTFEYNIELGAKRARAVRDHLISLGVDASRVETISYGEERPAVEGSTERAWSQNRRAEFELSAP